MKRFILIIIISLVAAIPAVSQEKLKKAPERTHSVYTLIDSARLQLSSPQKSFELIEKALVQSLQSKDKLGEGLSYQVLGLINVTLNQHDLAVGYFQKALSLFEGLRNRMHMNETYGLLGDAFLSLREYDNSLSMYTKYLETSPNVAIGKQARYNLASVYEAKGMTDQALKLLNEVLAIEQSDNNKQGIVEAQNRISKIYSSINQDDRAISNYQRSAKIAGEMEDKKALSNTLKEQGAALRRRGRYDEELQVRQELLDLSEEKQDLPALISENREIGAIYIEKKEADKAIPYIQRSIELSSASGKLEEKGKALQTLSMAYKEQMAFDMALEAYKQYVETADEMHQQRENDIKTGMQLTTTLNRKLERLDLVEKELQLSQRTLDLLIQEQLVDKKTLKAQQMLTYSLMSALAILLIASAFVYRSGDQKRKANQTLALRSLRSQMNPHFIYNSLNSVNNHISRKDEKAANKYLSDFSRLMRSVMENSKHDFVPLASEIEILKLYLFLEHGRFNDKFDYDFKVDPEIDTDAFQIPPMLIQPFVENAIWHGLRYRDSKGKLELAIIKTDRGIEIDIIDDGIGRKNSEAVKTKNQKEHNSTGLLNIRNRIELINQLFNIKLEVIIEDLDIERKLGTKVKIILPN